ncbi:MULTISPECIES: flavin reductase family protein [Rhodococcus]|uniref:Flavin reductase family protein n=1 Tax=Rhodococcus pseudokoreensis TaxID=2811421 RepID=A0A974ZYF7_9NOCA|nr:MULTISPECIES: flavin reductase family protein [Rhodococcus]MBV6756984.1 flavin reductase family protein [Rhodococcus opacus]QSE95064.1 flavin reductase family protein [Rhodococcus pseudokoreensis]
MSISTDTPDRTGTTSIAEEFKDAMASLCAPVTVITAMNDGMPVGATVSAFGSLSLTPPMITVALDRRSRVLTAVTATGRLGVNILGEHDEELARIFATGGIDRFAEAPWRIDSGLPRLSDAPGWLGCDVARTVGGGDHVIILGQVRTVETRPAHTLSYSKRRFGIHTPLPASARP